LDDIGKNLIFCEREGDIRAAVPILIGVPLVWLASVLGSGLGSGFDRIGLQQLPRCKLGQFPGVLFVC
tara:strand:+ start:225 stop:428 length:204 start_codon:yes stop_codon:yes gene_type:complete